MDDHHWERLEKQLRSMKSDQEEMLTHMCVGQESMMKRMEEVNSITQASPKTDPIASPETPPPKINPLAPQTPKIQSLQL
jgi:TolA-binding protein